MSLGSGSGRCVCLWRCRLLSLPSGEQASGRRWDCSGLVHVAKMVTPVIRTTVCSYTYTYKPTNEDCSVKLSIFPGPYPPCKAIRGCEKINVTTCFCADKARDSRGTKDSFIYACLFWPSFDWPRTHSPIKIYCPNGPQTFYREKFFFQIKKVGIFSYYLMICDEFNI